MSNNIGIFDMDGSLFDFVGAMTKSLNKLRSPNEPEIKNLWGEERQPWLKARMDLIKSVPGWWRNLEPIPAGMQIYELAQSIGFDCKILTKGPSSKSLAWMEKIDCCRKHLGENIDVQITSGTRNKDGKEISGKGRVYGKFLYDDYPEFMLEWLEYRPRGLGIMPVNEFNKGFSHPRVIMWDGTNFEEVHKALLLCYNREKKQSLDTTWKLCSTS